MRKEWATVSGMLLRVSLPICLAVMACANMASNRWSAGSVVIGLAVTVGLAFLARWTGLGLSDRGLARSTRLSGLRWGGVCVAVAAIAYGAALVVPAAREAVAGSAGSWPQALVAALLVIPLGTVNEPFWPGGRRC